MWLNDIDFELKKICNTVLTLFLIQEILYKPFKQL